MSKRTLIRNVRLFDPSQGHDGPGGVVLYGKRIVAVFGGASAIAAEAEVVERLLAPRALARAARTTCSAWGHA